MAATASPARTAAMPGGERPRPGRGFGLWRLATAPLLRRKSRAMLSVSALALAAALVTCLVSVYGGVAHNLSSAFRGAGPNLVVTPAASGALLTSTAAARALAAVAPAARGAGVLYAIGSANGQAIAIAGTDLQRLRALNPGWRVTGSLPAGGETWLGVNAARLLGVQRGGTVAVEYGLRRQSWRVAGLVQSGASEDDQVLAPLAAVEALTGLDGFTTLELRVAAGPGAIAAVTARLAAELPAARIRPVRPIVASEGDIVLHAHNLLLAASALILLTVALCVAAALTTLAIERRRDFGLMKALGGTETQVLLALAGEAAAMGLIGAVAGIALGGLAAGIIGRTLFGVWFRPGASAVALAAALTLALAVAAAMAPWPIVRQAQPAAILRGE